MSELFYTAPSDKIFNDVKASAIKIWKTYDDTYGYATEKIKRIENIQNIRDNACYIIAMFDTWNKVSLGKTLEHDESREWFSKIMDEYQSQMQ